MRQTSSDECEEEAGFALVAVLWFLVLVSAVVASFAVAARTDLLIASNAHQKLRLDLLAENVATMVSRLLAESDLRVASQFTLDSTTLSCPAGRYVLEVRIQDQAGLIDLNTADARLLAIGLRTLGLAPGEDETAAKAVVGFRTYRYTDVSDRTDIDTFGGPKGAPFESVVELSDFEPLGQFEPAEFHRVFTALSRQSLVLVSRSPRALAEALQGVQAGVNRSEGGRAQSLALEVTVRDRSTAIRGYAGYLIQQPESSNGEFKRVEPLVEPALNPQPNMPGNCPASLQSDIAAFLADRA